MIEEEIWEGVINRVKVLLFFYGGGENEVWYVVIEGGVDVFEDGLVIFVYVVIYYEGYWLVGWSVNLFLLVSVY